MHIFLIGQVKFSEIQRKVSFTGEGNFKNARGLGLKVELKK